MLVPNIKPIYFLVAGVGYNFANWFDIPGISKIVHGLNILYAEKQVRDYIGELKCCSQAAAERLAAAAESESRNYVAITGAITSNRYRRGPNEFFYYMSLEGQKINGHVTLPKLDELVHNTSTPIAIQQRRQHDSHSVQSYIEAQLNILADNL